MTSPSKHSRESSHALAVGMYWATRVSSIGLQMAILPGLGYLADHHFGTLPVLTILGACLGFGLAMREVFQLADGGVDRRIGGSTPRRKPRSQPPQDDS